MENNNLPENISLRDWLAGMALQRLLAEGAIQGSGKEDWTTDGYAEISYLYADAMLKARGEG